ncbi:hypothetical protein IAR55_006953 [Kwoniella newhampshirensis]|uniref:GLTSCR protein conserved domain-containing protein n=1 Tax=Kwoniella newhampshirensis TaxID=1651941 RepID=A0AAW0YTV1_9TREE
MSSSQPISSSTPIDNTLIPSSGPTSGDIALTTEHDVLPSPQRPVVKKEGDDNASPLPPAQNKSTASTIPTPFPGHVDAQPGSSTGWEKESVVKKRKWSMMGYDEGEMGWLMGECTSLTLALLLDQTATLYPPQPTAFSSYEDAVDRLLPYHVWQIHDEELEGWKKGDEEAELKEAEELVGRIRGIKDRFTKARRKEDDHPSPVPPLISILNSSTSIVREELSALQATLRHLRAEYTVIENEQKRIQDEKRRLEEEKRRAEEQKRKELLEEEERKRVAKMATEAAKVVVPPPAPKSTSTPTPTAPVPSPRPAPATPPPTSAPPSTPVSNADRGRPRGRPRGRGRGGLRESVITHTTGQGPAHPAGQSNSSAAPTVNTATHNLPSRTSLPAASTSIGVPTPPTQNGQNGATPVTPGTVPSTGAAAAQGPVNITVNVSLIPQLVALGLLVVPANPTAPKTPATVVRTSEDKKSVVLSINLSACSKNQLLGLAKVLNVSTKPAGAPAAGASGANANK